MNKNIFSIFSKLFQDINVLIKMRITFRQKKEKDNQFVNDLFFSHKIKELKADIWPENMKHQMCLMQFNAFENSLAEKRENVQDLIIKGDSESLGRIILSESEHSVLIEYIGIMPAFQNKGIGKEVMQLIIKDTVRTEKKLTLNVSKTNPAYYLYKKLGFVVTNKDELKYSMIYNSS